jgi:hypothetical protein
MKRPGDSRWGVDDAPGLRSSSGVRLRWKPSRHRSGPLYRTRRRSARACLGARHFSGHIVLIAWQPYRPPHHSNCGSRVLSRAIRRDQPESLRADALRIHQSGILSPTYPV